MRGIKKREQEEGADAARGGEGSEYLIGDKYSSKCAAGQRF